MSSHGSALQILQIWASFPRDHYSLSFESHSFSMLKPSWKRVVILLGSLLLSSLAFQASFYIKWYIVREQGVG